jgi:transposase-like protein
VAAFCRERGLCAPQFYAWKKRLREAAAGQGVLRAPLTKFVEVQVAPGGWEEGGAARDAGAAGVVRGASVSRAAGDERVEVLLKNGRSLRVGPGFDAELVRALVAVVESAA